MVDYFLVGGKRRRLGLVDISRAFTQSDYLHADGRPFLHGYQNILVSVMKCGMVILQLATSELFLKTIRCVEYLQISWLTAESDLGLSCIDPYMVRATPLIVDGWKYRKS